MVYAPAAEIAAGEGRAANAGYDAFIPLVDSGIAGYFWTGAQFFSLVIYSCAAFDAGRAVAYTAGALGAPEPPVHGAF